MFMGQVQTDREQKELYTIFLWNMYYMLQEEPLSAWRNGIAFVVDMYDFGWKNIDILNHLIAREEQ